MLNASKLKSFQEAAQKAVPEITKLITVVSDNDVADFTRDIKARDNEVVLVGVLPSMNLDYRDEDNITDKNSMLLFVVKKFDIKKSNDDFLKTYDETGSVVKKMVAWLLEENSKFICSSLFKGIDFRTFSVDPVRDYHSFFGYVINFELNN